MRTSSECFRVSPLDVFSCYRSRTSTPTISKPLITIGSLLSTSFTIRLYRWGFGECFLSRRENWGELLLKAIFNNRKKGAHSQINGHITHSQPPPQCLVPLTLHSGVGQVWMTSCIEPSFPKLKSNIDYSIRQWTRFSFTNIPTFSSKQSADLAKILL